MFILSENTVSPNCTIPDREKRHGIVIVVLLFLINLIWFLPFLKSGFIMGDDLSFPVFIQNLTLRDAIIPADATKYRPVFNIFIYMVSRIITGTYSEYFFINLIIYWINSIVIYEICNLIGGNKLRSFAISCLFITCQFSYYNVLQGIGMTEGLALFFVLEGIFFGVHYCQKERVKDYLLVVLFTFLACFTHERYIVLSIVCVLLAFMIGNHGWKRKIILALIGLIPMIFNWFTKSVLFRSNFMTGTDGQSISLSIGSIISFFLEGMMAIFGINNGPEYLNGYTFTHYTTLQKIMAIVLVILLLTGTAYTLVKAIREKKNRIRKLQLFLLFCFLAGGTLISGCVTIRLELRWVLAPFTVFLVFLSYAAYTQSNQRIATGWIILITLLWLPINYAYSQRLGSIYFIRSMNIAKQTYQSTIQQYGESLSDSEVFLIGSDEMEWAVGLQPWQPTSVFDIYMKKKPSIHFVKSEEEIKTNSRNVKVFRQNDDLSVSEILFFPEQEIILDLNKSNDIKILPDTPAATPTGKGVLVYDNAITVLSGYSVTSEPTNIPEGAKLFLSARIPYQESDGARLNVYLQNEEDKNMIYQDEIYPYQPIENQMILVGFPMNNAELIVEVTSPTGDDILDWVVMDKCYLYQEN